MDPTAKADRRNKRTYLIEGVLEQAGDPGTPWDRAVCLPLPGIWFTSYPSSGNYLDPPREVDFALITI